MTVGLSMSHISPRPAPGGVSSEDVPPGYRVEIASGGTFVQLRGHGGPVSGGGPRGEVFGFSRASRKRMLDRLNQVPVDVLSSALFVSLTFPDAFPSVQESKRCVDTFLKRLRREYPRCSGIWRLERVPRMSGANVGKLAPHYHVLVFGVPWMSTEWLTRSWYESVGSGDVRHLQAGTAVQRVRSRRGALYYCSKYMGKPEAIADGAWSGRCWAEFGVAWLAVLVRSFAVSSEQFYRIRRVLRSWVLKSWRGGGAVRSRWARAPGLGLTAYLSEAMGLRLMSWAAEPV